MGNWENSAGEFQPAVLSLPRKNTIIIVCYPLQTLSWILLYDWDSYFNDFTEWVIETKLKTKLGTDWVETNHYGNRINMCCIIIFLKLKNPILHRVLQKNMLSILLALPICYLSYWSNGKIYCKWFSRKQGLLNTSIRPYYEHFPMIGWWKYLSSGVVCWSL